MWTIFKVFIEFVTILLLLLATLTRDQTHTFCFGRQKSEPLDHLCARLSRTNIKKRCPFHHRGLECKSRKSGDTWSNRQIWPWSTEWSRAKANRVLPREHTGHSKHPHPTTQEKTLHMDITRRSTPKSDWLYCWQLKTEKLYIVGKKKDQELWLRPWTYYKKVKSESHSVVSNSVRPHGLYSPWNSPGQDTGVGSLSLLQGIFPT